MDLVSLTREHRELVARAAALSGMAAGLKTGDDADEAVAQIEVFGRLMLEHLTVEDRDVYSVLMESSDPELRMLATTAFSDVGGLVSAWRMLSAHWTRAAILADPARFADAMACTVNALMSRVAVEEDVLYPAAQAAARARSAAKTAA
jgi:hypothetical protein